MFKVCSSYPTLRNKPPQNLVVLNNSIYYGHFHLTELVRNTNRKGQTIFKERGIRTPFGGRSINECVNMF